MQNTITLVSSFSFGMCEEIQNSKGVQVLAVCVSLQAAQRLVHKQKITNCIGHNATLRMVSSMLDIQLDDIDPQNRPRASFTTDDNILVCQYVGKRLAEGEVIENPDINDFKWIQVALLPVTPYVADEFVRQRSTNKRTIVGVNHNGEFILSDDCDFSD